MRRALSFVLFAAMIPAPALAAGPLQRFALVVGANSGGGDRPRLQYAVADAERFARVMVELGGVAPANEIVLKQPKLRELIGALDLMAGRVASARGAAGAAGRTELVLYYSGHADENGLMLGDERYPYRALRDRLDRITADVRIAVLDACASGAFTRLKGGRARPPFLVDESADMRGHAFLTSSAETESAQESDRIGASYFTHYLVSGFRGAADTSGDGKVTLNEAYQFAFAETLRRTIDTRGGAQHPSYDINLSGTGDVVMTDVRQTTATLVLGDDLDGRFFIRNASQELVVELHKPQGRTVELGLEPGVYEIRVERDKGSFSAKAQVPDGGRFVLEARQFGPAAIEATRRRGGPTPGFRYAVAGRNRIDLRVGMWRTGGDDIATSGASSDILGGLQYTRYISERLAMTFAIDGVAVEAGSMVTMQGAFSGSVAVAAMPIGVRWDPLPADRRASPFKPYLAVGVGPVFGSSSGSFAGHGAAFSGSQTLTTVGGHVGGGVDTYPGRSFSIGVNAGYNWMANFSRAVGARDNYSGVEVAVNFGVLFGRGATHDERRSPR
jgi:caspase domain-containing protein